MSRLSPTFEEYLNLNPVVLTGGGFGTTLQLKGYELHPESWSGEANLKDPGLVRKVQNSFHDAGLDILVANTFHSDEACIERMLKAFRGAASEFAGNLGIDLKTNHPARELAYIATRRAVDAALDCKRNSERLVWVAGSIGPVNDTHSEDRSQDLPLNVLREAHNRHAQLLKDCGVDILVAETIPTLDEAVAMTEAAARTGLPLVASFVLNPKTGNLFDGTTIREAVRATDVNGRAAITFNCTPAAAIGPALNRLLDCYSGSVGAYPNFGCPADDKVHWVHDHEQESVQEFTDAVLGWREKDPSRVTLLGVCCGGAPSHMEALRAAADESVGCGPRQRDYAYGHTGAHAGMAANLA